MRSNEKPRVAYVVSAWPRLSETFILNEVISMERLGVRLRIFTLKEAEDKVANPKASDVHAPVTCLSIRRNPKSIGQSSIRFFLRQPVRFCQTAIRALRYRRWGVLRCFFQATYLAEIVARESLTHLHAHFAHDPTLVTMFAHYLTGIPYSFTAHAKDIYVKTSPELLRAEAQTAQAVVTCTEYNRRYISTQIGSGSSGKLHCIYHGLDLSQFKFCSVRAANGELPVILSAARLVEKKGLKDLILAADIVRQRGRHFRIEIVGDGPLRQSLEERVRRLGLNDHIRFLGPLPHEKLCRIYQSVCLFALPCIVTADGDRDGIPNVLLEAMASGVPVVSTPVSGIPEVIRSEAEGLLVPPNSPVALADAMDRLLGSPELRERLALAARAKIENCFSIERNSAQLLSLFQRVGANENTLSV
ncbi:MAG TPA: glycosyltransferase [Candidatus Bathyarchaeia archaeon]|jgi:glycosyltransferase involved in cell wall biosynthesis|nr:glycosyltransferase [Candidatus Bathyarchaeia archaeon]